MHCLSKVRNVLNFFQSPYVVKSKSSTQRYVVDWNTILNYEVLFIIYNTVKTYLWY